MSHCETCLHTYFTNEHHTAFRDRALDTSDHLVQCGGCGHEAEIERLTGELQMKSELSEMQHLIIETMGTQETDREATLATLTAERDALRAEAKEWRHRAIGGTCRMLSVGDACECSLCQRDRTIAQLRADLQATTSAPCHWTEDTEGNYDTDCGETFTIIEGTPADNSMRFCCYCGKQLVAVPYVEEMEP